MDLIAIARWIPTKREPKGDDGVDRLHYVFTPAILSAFAVLIGMQHYVGDPISCWGDAHLSSSNMKYAKSYCWVSNTYHLPWEEDISRDLDKRKEGEIVYYQWLPILLIGQAILFYIPHALWTTLNSNAGVDADNILEAAVDLEVTLKMKTRQDRLKLITNQIQRFIGARKSRTKGVTFSFQHLLSTLCCCICGKRFGNYLTLLYIVIKIIYIGNVLLQMYMLSPIFKTAFHELGWDAIQNMWYDKNHIIHPSIFPKVTICDFVVRRLGNLHRYSMQCVLPVNEFAEKMYLFLWFWFVLVFFVSSFNVIIWIIRAVIPAGRHRYIEDHLDTTLRLDTEKKMSMVDKFVYDFLKQDGVFLIRLIGHNTSQLTAADVTASLWDTWIDRQEGRIKPCEGNRRKSSQEPEGSSEPTSRRNSIQKPPLPTVLHTMPMVIPGAVDFHAHAPPYHGTPQTPAYAEAATPPFLLGVEMQPLGPGSQHPHPLAAPSVNYSQPPLLGPPPHLQQPPLLGPPPHLQQPQPGTPTSPFLYPWGSIDDTSVKKDM